MVARRRVGRLGQAAAAQHQRLLKALIAGAHRVVVAQVPLAENAGLISGFREHLGSGHLARIHHRAAEECVDDASAVVVAARHEARPRGRAHRANLELRELHAFAGDAVHGRGVEVRIAVQGEVAIALIVGNDEYDVRPALGLGCQQGASGEGEKGSTVHRPISLSGRRPGASATG